MLEGEDMSSSSIAFLKRGSSSVLNLQGLHSTMPAALLLLAEDLLRA